MTATWKITLAIVLDGEKPEGLLADSLAALRLLSGRHLDRLQVIIIDQASGGRAVEAVAASRLDPPPAIVAAGEEEAADGYPIWDVVAELARARQYMRGRYLLYAHPEMLLGADYVATACTALEAAGFPPLAMANLVRPGHPRSILAGARFTGPSPAEADCISTRIRQAVAAGEGSLREVLADAPYCRWAVWRSPPPAGCWAEDAFLMRLDWADAAGFFAPHSPMPFVDAFLPLQRALELLAEYELAPRVRRLPEAARIWHLHHERGYGWQRPSVRRWLAASELWGASVYSDAATWDEAQPRRQRARRVWSEASGPVEKWLRNYRTWLSLGGIDRLAAWNQRNAA
jgi:hypothetical protein